MDGWLRGSAACAYDDLAPGPLFLDVGVGGLGGACVCGEEEGGVWGGSISTWMCPPVTCVLKVIKSLPNSFLPCLSKPVPQYLSVTVCSKVLPTEFRSASLNSMCCAYFALKMVYIRSPACWCQDFRFGISMFFVRDFA